MRLLWAAVTLGGVIAMCAGTADALEVIDTRYLRFELDPETGAHALLDKASGVEWRSGGGLGSAMLARSRQATLGRCEVRREGAAIVCSFAPELAKPASTVTVRIAPDREGKELEFSWQASPELGVEGVRLLGGLLKVDAAEGGCALVPVRKGMLIPAGSAPQFSHWFDTYAYEGCHMAMLGLVKSGSGLLVWWDDPYVIAELSSSGPAGARGLGAAIQLKKSARRVVLRPCGRGDHLTVAEAYREVARRKGFLVSWDEKLKTNPERSKLFGAINFKLWSCLERRMSEDSTKEEHVHVNWTFEEAAQVAEHLKRDLGLDRVLFTLGGWIRRGYDNQHPDILPAAPECGGDKALADCARRVMALGYLFCLHDNYQDMYRDSPSWDESYLQKNPDGKPAVGGRWAGGRAYLTCSKRALDLARRPQNLPAVKALTQANAYFIDTTYAAGLQECYDPAHPLARSDDMKWKQELSDYARSIFGVFGSECGREWAIPHSDFFEGLTGVSGRHYHDEKLLARLGGVSVPLFELVYRDCIAMHGKYGYDPARAAEYVLHHAIIGRTLNYHNVPAHIYWKRPGELGPLALEPVAAEVRPTGPREFSISYRWRVRKPPQKDWRVFVHFTDASDAIRFQNDHDPSPPSSRWAAGDVVQGPFTIRVPDGLEGAFHLRIGLYDPEGGERASIEGPQDDARRTTLGRLLVSKQGLAFEPEPREARQAAFADAEAAGIFCRADGGWAEGLHLFDRFVKNTYEILSPLNELTSRLRMTRHEFITSDRLVQRSVFGEGAKAVEVIVNLGREPFKCTSRLGGEVVLPRYGLLIESETFVGFVATSFGGLRYEGPALFTLRSLDGRPIARSGRVRVFHGFGDSRLMLGGKVRDVPKEAVVAAR